MHILFRVLLFCSILIIGYLLIKYIFNPKRKLELAHANKELFLHDHFNKVKKNLLVTQKGVLFEGEKYMGTADQAFRVIHIKMWAHSPSKLHGLSKNDFVQMEEIIFKQYPYATIEWQSPVKELLHEEK